MGSTLVWVLGVQFWTPKLKFSIERNSFVGIGGPLLGPQMVVVLDPKISMRGR